MGYENMPNKVKNVIRDSNNDVPGARKHHQAMSRKGGIESAKIKSEKKVFEEVNKESQILDAVNEAAKQYTINDDGDVLPPNPEEIAFIKEQND